MKLEQQVCNRDLAEKLKELGVAQFSLFEWGYYKILPGRGEIPPALPKRYRVFSKDKKPGTFFPYKEYAAFTVAELSLMLGKRFPSWQFMNLEGKTQWIATVLGPKPKGKRSIIFTYSEFDRFADTQADALATLLISCIETGYLSFKEVNERLIA